jgi:hypothetical protein
MLQFNTAGPMQADLHYIIPPLTRFDLEEVLMLIQARRYFVMHAPRQTGKTSCLLALQEYLNNRGQYRCLYVNVEVGQAARDNVDAALPAIVAQLIQRMQQMFGDTSFLGDLKQYPSPVSAHNLLNQVLTKWTEQSHTPTVLLVDEIDSLVGDTLISVLRQLRTGYDQRPARFPSTVILCGVRDVKDYRIQTSGKEIITGGSAFNIKTESLRLGDFSFAEVRSLYLQHTTETGQVFAEGVLELVWHLTQGQPWLVNALAQQACFRMKENRDRSRPITVEIIQQAKNELILRRETHIDQLAFRLKEPRVRAVIEPILRGEELDNTISDDDKSYLIDLGLLRQAAGQALTIANPIYQEIIPRHLTTILQDNLLASTPDHQWYLLPDGRLDMNGLLHAFQQFFRENSEAWLQGFDYHEAGPQLLMQAFLQRIVNGGGRVEREYGLGRGRTDLLVLWRANAKLPISQAPNLPMQRIVIELKLQRGRLDSVLQKGLEQTAQYADRCNADEAHLILFDRRPKRTWRNKIYRREETWQDRPITVWGC